MTFINPKTWEVGEILSAVDMNVYVRDNSTDLDDRINDITGGPFSYRFAGRRVVTSTATVTFNDLFGDGTDTSFVRALRFIAQGGGGGGAGGGATAKVGGGGGAGAMIEVFTTSLASYQPSFSVTVGPAGAGGANEGSGSSGGNTSLPSIFAAGGQGGTISTISQAVDMRSGAGGSGGTTSGLTTSSSTGYRISISGDNGLSGFSIITSSDASGLQVAGNGANSRFGRGGRPAQNKGGSPTGADAAQFGAGGGGGVLTGAGGDGGPGLVIIDMFR